MFKKKLICTLLSLTFLSSFMIENVSYAADTDELSDSYESESTAFPVLDDEEFEALMEEVRAEAKANITPELRQEVEEIQEELNNCEELQEILSPRYVASIDSISLEFELDSHDGMNLVDIVAIGLTYANKARDTAEGLYIDLGSSVEMKRDAFRHSYWNFLSINNGDDTDARIASINHEWVALILPDVQAYEEERYSIHKVPEISSSEASRLAVLDSYAYAVSLRDQLMKTCRLSLPAFNTVFEKGSYIMDFWNNEVGRSYGKIFPADSWIVFFPSIWDSGELIKHEGQEEITIARRIKLFQSDWWYIN